MRGRMRRPIKRLRERSVGHARLVMAGLLISLTICTVTRNAHAEGDWYVTGYYARLNNANLADTMALNFSWEDDNILILGLGRRLTTLWSHLNLEAEGQVGKHFGDQDNFEFNALVIARWLTFPWNDHLITTLAAGEGISYATDVPEVEEENHDKSARLLDYLMFELTFALPRHAQWSLVTRVHHRSGAWGLFDGVHGASNALAFGLRYHF
jgi:hypothetical protein